MCVIFISTYIESNSNVLILLLLLWRININRKRSVLAERSNLLP